MRKFGSLVNNMKRVLNNAVVQFLLGQCDNKYSTAYNFVQNIKKANYMVQNIYYLKIYSTWFLVPICFIARHIFYEFENPFINFSLSCKKS